MAAHHTTRSSADIPMSEHDVNPYIVNGLKNFFKMPDYTDAAFWARKNAENIAKGQKSNKQCYEAMQKDNSLYSRHPSCAKVDNTTGLYTCYFMRDGRFMSGTTKVKPLEHALSLLFSSEYANVEEQPWDCEVQGKSQGLWRAYPNCS